LLALGFSSLSFIVLAYFVSQKPSSPSHPPPTLLAPDISCLSDVRHVSPANIHGEQSDGYARTEPRVLLVVETPYTRLGQAIVVILESVRFKHRVQVTIDIFVDYMYLLAISMFRCSFSKCIIFVKCHCTTIISSFLTN